MIKRILGVIFIVIFIIIAQNVVFANQLNISSPTQIDLLNEQKLKNEIKNVNFSFRKLKKCQKYVYSESIVFIVLICI